MKKNIVFLTTIILFLLPVTIVSAQTKTVMVQRGETFKTIAEKHGMTVDQLEAINPDVKDIHVGTMLKVFDGQPASSAYAADKNVVNNKKHKVSKEQKKQWKKENEALEKATMLLEANELAEAGKYAKAVKLYSKIKGEDLGLARLGRAYCYAKLKKYKKAIYDLEWVNLCGKLNKEAMDYASDLLVKVKKLRAQQVQQRNQMWAGIGLAMAYTGAAASAAMNSSNTSTSMSSYSMPRFNNYSVSNVNVNTDFTKMSPQIVNQSIAHAGYAEEQNYQRYGASAGMSRAEYYGALANLNNSPEGQKIKAEGQKREANIDQNTYNQLARQTEQYFKFMTGDKYTESGGSITGKLDASHVSDGTIAMKRLQKLQKDMKDARLSAQKNGLTIPQSPWETATVHY